jgi:trimeric autotransporter adhesin
MAVLLLVGCGEGASSSVAGHSAQSASVSPASGSGSTQSFTLSFSDPKGADHIKSARMLVNTFMDGRKGCYIYYDRPQNAFLLVNDNGVGSAQMTVGAASEIGNSRCRLSGAVSTVLSAETNLTIRLNLVFDPSFAGEKQIFLSSEDADDLTKDLQPYGKWIVP